MTTENRNLSRRQTLVGISLAGATAMVPGASIAKAAQPERSAWNAAVARLERAEQEEARLSALTSTAHEAAEAACPRREEFFRRYRMGHGWSRDRNFRAAHLSLVIERSRDRHLTADEAKQVTADAYRIVDDFEAYSARHDAAFADYDALEAQFDAAVDARHEAQTALFNCEAPDHAALLFKIELLTRILDEVEADDAQSLAALRIDARRLLGRA